MKANKKRCPQCESAMVKNGKDRYGRQRWLCRSCGTTTRWKNDVTARDLHAFLEVITGKITHRDLPGCGRTFRRKALKLWQIWPVCQPDGQVHRVIHVDGIHLGRHAVVLIACTSEHVVAWHVARRESTQAYMDLLAKIPPPQVVVADGGTGFSKARARLWPTTRVQRCVFHAFNQVKRYTTTHSRSVCGQQLYGLALALLGVKTPHAMEQWITDFYAWHDTWKGFLAEKTRNEKGAMVYTHERLRKAFTGLHKLIASGDLFTFLDPDLYADGEIIGSLPSTNNQIEGAVNSPLRELLHRHRGMSLDHRIRTIAWWCYLHTENHLPPAQILAIMPSNADITQAYRQANAFQTADPNTRRWGTSIDWNDLHTTTPYRNDWEI